MSNDCLATSQQGMEILKREGLLAESAIDRLAGDASRDGELQEEDRGWGG